MSIRVLCIPQVMLALGTFQESELLQTGLRFDAYGTVNCAEMRNRRDMLTYSLVCATMRSSCSRSRIPSLGSTTVLSPLK